MSIHARLSAHEDGNNGHLTQASAVEQVYGFLGGNNHPDTEIQGVLARDHLWLEPVDLPPEPAVVAAEWYVPGAPILVVPAGPPYGFAACTFAWSYRYAPGELDSPATSYMVYTAQFSRISINGYDEPSGYGVAAVGSASDWSPVSFSATGADQHRAFADAANNLVFLFDAAGGLSGGNTAQLWHNGDLILTSNSAVADLAMAELYFMGDQGGANQIPGETQGYWWSADTAMDPATMFDTLFDGANGMVDLADTTIDGVTPDAVYINSAGDGGLTVDVPLGAYAQTGQVPGLTIQRWVDAPAGSYTATGQVPALTTARRIEVPLGAYAQTGFALEFIRALRVEASVGAFAATGQTPALARALRVEAPAGALTLTGYAPALSIATTLAAPVGSFTQSGLVPSLTRTLLTTPAAGDFDLTGLVPALPRALRIDAPAGPSHGLGRPPLLRDP